VTYQKNCTPQVNGSGVYRPIIPTSNLLTYYLSNTASSIATYLQEISAPYTPKTTLTFSSLATGTDVLQNWSTNAGVPGLSFLQAGPYVFHVHALHTAGGTVTLFAQFWEVSNVGVDIAMIGQTESSVAVGAAETEFSLAYVNGNTYTLGSTASRIVARVFVVVSGSSPTVQLFVGGTADSHITLPANGTSSGGSSTGAANAVQTADGAGGFLDSGCTATGGAMSCSAGYSSSGPYSSSGATSAKPAAPVSSSLLGWFDSTDLIPEWQNSSGTVVAVATVPAASPTANQFVDNIGTNGVQHKRAIAAGDQPATPVPTPGTSVTLTGPRGYAKCTGTCTVTVPAPALGNEFCIYNGVGVSTAITLSALGSDNYYSKPDLTAYGTVNSTLVSTAHAGAKICIVAIDTTHYDVLSVDDATKWTAN
jgi:hypothetical protein